MSNRFALAALATTIIAFFGGWLLWGILLRDYFQANTTELALQLERDEADMVWWAVVLAQVGWGVLVTWVVARTGSTTPAKGAVTAAILGLLVGITLDFSFYSMMDMHKGLGVLFVDIIVNGLLAAIMGAVAGWILGRTPETMATPAVA